MTIRLVLSMTVLVLSGCASQVPVLIKLPPNPDPQFQEVKKNVDTFQNQYVRWGGKIISVENKADSTLIEVLASPLNHYGLPSSNNSYEGRFLAKVDEFLDPEYYSKERKLTIFGTVESELVRRIDDHPYSYPLVRVKQYYLWPEYRTTQYRHYYYDPFYPYPGYYRPYYRHHFGFYNRYRYFGYRGYY